MNVLRTLDLGQPDGHAVDRPTAHMAPDTWNGAAYDPGPKGGQDIDSLSRSIDHR